MFACFNPLSDCNYCHNLWPWWMWLSLLVVTCRIGWTGLVHGRLRLGGEVMLEGPPARMVAAAWVVLMPLVFYGQYSGRLDTVSHCGSHIPPVTAAEMSFCGPMPNVSQAPWPPCMNWRYSKISRTCLLQ